MKKNTVKLLIVAACFTLPIFGTDLMAREHHHRETNTAVKILNAVGRILNPQPTVVVHRPAHVVDYRPAVVVHRPAPPVHIKRHTPPPPPRRNHAPARPAGKGGHRR